MPCVNRSVDMCHFQQGVGSNNDTIFQCKNVRSIVISENADNQKISEEFFKKLVGGDTISTQAKYKNAVSCRFPGKLTFYQNDQPKWNAADAFAIRRRIWLLPMRAQHLKKDDTVQRGKLTREGKSHHIVDLDPSYDILEDLKTNHVQAYLKWVVDGAVTYYNSGIKDVPNTIKIESDREGRDKMQLFENFITDHLISAPSEAFISSEEIKEVFLLSEGFDTSLDTKTEREIYRLLRKLLAPKMDSEKAQNQNIRGIIRGVRTGTRLYPGRIGKHKVVGYLGIAWKPGEVAKVVNNLREEYQNNNLPPISDATVSDDEDASMADIASNMPRGISNE